MVLSIKQGIMQDINIKALLAKYERDECSVEEIEAIETWYLYYGLESQYEPGHEQVEIATDNIWNRLERENAGNKPRYLWYRWTAAAIVTLVIGAALFYLYPNFSTQQQIANTEILPGRSRAVLTLADGTNIQLSDAKTGIIIGQHLKYSDQTSVLANDEEQVVRENHQMMLTATTPRGGTYKITLPDGTQVWLNSASKLTFPASFKNHSERRVTLNGEAYFEVAKNKVLPFKVISEGQTVEVTGTHFNVNAYADEPAAKTTLIEGAVIVNNHQLLPGQQSLLNNGIISLHNADVDVETAWKNEEFIFNGNDLPAVLRQISRWYDVEIVYAVKPKSNVHFEGELSRKSNLSSIINMLEATGEVKFEVKERRLILIR